MPDLQAPTFPSDQGHGLTVPTGARVYRRPTPPVSHRQADQATPKTLPMSREATASNAENVEASRLKRIVTLLLPSIVAVFVLWGVCVWMSSQFKQSAAALPRHAKTNAQTSGLLPSSPQSPNGSLETVTTSSDVYDFADEAFWSEVIEGEEATDANRKPLAGAALLASRFYELERRPTGEIVAARMPARESHQRFGPSTEEIKALLALGSLEQLDLGDTIASSAVPIANRHANLRVLVLSDQTDTASLGRLSGIQELRLINSDVDRMALADRGIRVVYLDR